MAELLKRFEEEEEKAPPAPPKPPTSRGGYIPRPPKKPITSGSVIRAMIGKLDPTGILTKDELRLNNILTTQGGNINRNKTWQYSAIRLALDFLIEQGWISDKINKK